MPRNGSGQYVPVPGSFSPAIDGNPATADDWNALRDDMTAAISQSVSADGQTPMSGNLNMAGYKFTNLGAPTGNGQAVRWQQMIAGSDIPSAQKITIPNEGALFNVTGTTTIEELESSYVGRRIALRFEEELTLQASIQLLLPGAANVNVQPGDVVEFIQVEPGIWKSLDSGVASSGMLLFGPGTHTFIAQAERVLVTACAGGANGNANGSGGGGAFFVDREFTLTIGNTYSVVVGGAGVATSIVGVFTLAPGGASVLGVPGQGGAMSSEGTGGVSSRGGHAYGTEEFKGGAGGSLGPGGGLVGGAKIGGDQDATFYHGGDSYPNIFASPGAASTLFGDLGIGIIFGADGGFGGGGCYGVIDDDDGSHGRGGPGIMMIRWGSQ